MNIEDMPQEELRLMLDELNDQWNISEGDLVQVTDQFIDMKMGELMELDLIGYMHKESGNIVGHETNEENGVAKKIKNLIDSKYKYVMTYSFNRWFALNENNELIKKSFFVQKIISDVMRLDPENKAFAVLISKDDRVMLPIAHLKKIRTVHSGNDEITNTLKTIFLMNDPQALSPISGKLTP